MSAYYLLDDLEVMRPDDEALNHDCKTWWRLDSHPSGKWMVGTKYTRGLFVPMRRPGIRPTLDILATRPTPPPSQ